MPLSFGVKYLASLHFLLWWRVDGESGELCVHACISSASHVI